MDGLSELPSALLASPHRLGPTESDCEKPGCQARRAFSLCQNLWPRGAASFDLPNAPAPSPRYKRLRWLDNGSALRCARSIIARAIHAATEDILLAREAHFPTTIADLYDPDAAQAMMRSKKWS